MANVKEQAEDKPAGAEKRAEVVKEEETINLKKVEVNGDDNSMVRESEGKPREDSSEILNQ